VLQDVTANPDLQRPVGQVAFQRERLRKLPGEEFEQGLLVLPSHDGSALVRDSHDVPLQRKRRPSQPDQRRAEPPSLNTCLGRRVRGVTSCGKPDRAYAA